MKLILVDGSGFIFRAFHALPPMTRPDGVHVNAVFGFCNMLSKLLKDQTGSHVAVIFDAGRVTFRNQIYDAYKAHRPEPPEELRPQFALIREATRAFGVPSIELAGWEADDLIAAYAKAGREAGAEVVIISSDKDLMQLLRPGVSMWDAMKNQPIGLDEVAAKFGVTPDKVVEVQALIGDSVDNVPGVPGIGPKGAAALIGEFGTLDAVLAAAPAMKPSKRRDALIEHADKARLSKELVTLRDDAPLPVPVADLAATPWEPAVLRAFLAENGFKSLIGKLRLEGAGAPGALEAEAAQAPAEPAGPFGPYPVITTPEALAALLAEAGVSGYLAMVTLGDHAGYGLCARPGVASYVPVGHNLSLEDAPQLPREVVRAALAPVLADPGVLKIFHDAKAEQKTLGLPVEAFDDVMLISVAQDGGRWAHDVETLARQHLGHEAKTLEHVTGTGRARQTPADAPPQRAADYAAERADMVLRLHGALKPALRAHKALALYELVEKPLVPVLMAMETAGVMVDRGDLAAMSAEFEGRMAAFEAEAHRLAGHEFNVGSPKQLGEVLFEEMGLPGGKKGKAGAWGTDSAVLEGLAEQGVEIAQKIMDWRQLAKLKSTYADALVNLTDGQSRVHTVFQMAATTTGRLSSIEPNLQNIPIRTEEGARIRKTFIAPPGLALISADYSQIELRLLAHVANIAGLKESFARAEDIHARTASEVFGVPMAGMDAMTRRRAKAINFGIIYGISAFGLGRQLGVAPGEAKGYIDAYFARYPEIKTYMEAVKAEAREKGFVLTPFGRRVWVPKIGDKIPALRAYAERAAINAPLQGGAADIIKRAMVKLPGALRAAGLSARLLLQVHDELLIEAPQDEAEATAALARDVMQGAASLSVPLVVETGVGRNWGDAH
ncbi:DNA polymerase I [Acidocella sp.]|uniref:DNA polymerase I n=1 Tax=Acidocella sp. TaxID=50710 RepID=UPI00260AF041|nr:DNA polymerase I [Acidocella sp.]